MQESTLAWKRCVIDNSNNCSAMERVLLWRWASRLIWTVPGAYLGAVYE